MSTNKKVSYISLLKEAVVNDPESDTSKTVDLKGPMLDPIIGYDGTGELKTHQDAASILERYYFKDETNDITSLSEAEDNPPEEGDPVEVGGQTEINKAKDEIVKSIEEMEKMEDEEEIKVKKIEDEENEDEENEDEEVNEFESAVLERLIAEMEEEDSEDKEEDSDLNIDKEMEEGFVPGEKGTENTDEEEINEMFHIFKEAIEDESDMDEEDVRKKLSKKK